MTALTPHPISPPLNTNPEGVVLVGSTRVPLDTVVGAFKLGASAEQIVEQYPSLALEDVYLVIAYYLRNTELVEQYLSERSDFREAVREENLRRFNSDGLRDRLLARMRKGYSMVSLSRP